MGETKYCPKCKLHLPLSLFGTSSRRKNGKASVCLKCQREYNKKWREKNPDYFKQWRKEHPDYEAGQARKRRKKNPAEYRCRQVANCAKSVGFLIPKDCEKCGAKDTIEMHHEDYSKPLDVVWLCRECHTYLRSKDVN